MLIGFAGPIGSGKDTAAGFLVKNQQFTRVGFADALKNAVGEVFGFSETQLYGSEKETPDPRYTKQDGTLLTPRYALQWLGTEGFRHCCPDIWVLKALRKAQDLMKLGIPGVTFSDVRFRNEHTLIRANHGILIRLLRGDVAHNHQSETELTTIPLDAYDYVIDNRNMSLLELEVEVSRIYADAKAKRL